MWFQECEGVYLGHGIRIEHGILQFHMMWETHHITSIQLVGTIWIGNSMATCKQAKQVKLHTRETGVVTCKLANADRIH